MPMSARAETSSASSFGIWRISSSCSRHIGMSAEGRSILLMTGMIARFWRIARLRFAIVCAWTPWDASMSRIAPSQAARLLETS